MIDRALKLAFQHRYKFVAVVDVAYKAEVFVVLSIDIVTVD